MARRFGTRPRKRKRSHDCTSSRGPLAFEQLESRRYLAITVDTTLDVVDINDGVTSLREAIVAANTIIGADTIEFEPALTAGGPATILLSQGEMKITEALTIDGPGADLLTIDAQEQSRIFNITANAGDFSIAGLTLTRGRIPATGFSLFDGGAVLSVTAGALVLDGVHLSGNLANNTGGAIYAKGALTLANCEVAGNHTTIRSGGALFVGGVLTVSNSEFVNNWTEGDRASGGAIHAVGAITILDSMFDGNRTEGGDSNGGTSYGGAVYGASQIIAERSLFRHNKTGTEGFDSGSALYALAQIDIKSCEFYENSVGEGRGYTVEANDGLTVTDSHIYDNKGGGISAFDDITVLRSIIERNEAFSPQSAGGGISSTNKGVTITDSSVLSNKVTGGSGGGIYASRVTATNSKIIGNAVVGGSGGGINAFGGTVTLINTIVAENSAQGTGGSGGGILAFRVDANSGSEIVGNHTDGPSAPGGAVWAKQVNFDHVLVKFNYTLGQNSIGGAVYSESVTISNSILENNFTNGTGAGGGAVRVAPVAGSPNSTIVNSSVTGNKTLGAQSAGGAIHISFGSLTISSSVIAENSTTGTSSAGGGIYSNQADLSIASSLISGNQTVGFNSDGGGIYKFFGQAVLISNTTISNNHTTGVDSDGGGIRARATLVDSVVARNFTLGDRSMAGGIFSMYSVTLANSTVSGNWTVGAKSHGGGIVTDDFFADRSTIVENHADHSASYAGGVWSRTQVDNKVAIVGSIVANNYAAVANPDLKTRIFLNNPPILPTAQVKFSLIGNKSGTSLLEAPIGSPDLNGNLIGGTVHGVIDPMLGPLANNGGPPWTHAPLPGSPAIGAGDPAAVAGTNGVPEFDQRGGPWSRVVGGRIDMGAVESQANPLPADYNFNGKVDTADYSVWRDTSGATNDLRADGSGAVAGVPDGIVDEVDYAFWKANFGNVLEVSGARGAALAGELRLAGTAASESNDLATTGASGAASNFFFRSTESVGLDRDRDPRDVARRLLHTDVERDDALATWVASRARNIASRGDGDLPSDSTSLDCDEKVTEIDRVFALLGDD